MLEIYGMFFNHSVYQVSSNWHHIWVWCSRKAVIDSSPLVDFPFSQEYIIFIIRLAGDHTFSQRRNSFSFADALYAFWCLFMHVNVRWFLAVWMICVMQNIVGGSNNARWICKILFFDMSSECIHCLFTWRVRNILENTQNLPLKLSNVI